MYVCMNSHAVMCYGVATVVYNISACMYVCMYERTYVCMYVHESMRFGQFSET
jgi:hypothetical protein